MPMKLGILRESSPKPSTGYPRKAQIARVVGAARESGIPVNNLEVGSDGHIRVGYSPPTATENSAADEDEFQRWEREGRL